MRDVAAAIMIIFSSPAAAQLPVTNANTQRAPVSVPATLTGEWGGLRTDLRNAGVDLTASYGSETASNIAGAGRDRIAETGQLIFGTTLDAGRLVGLTGGTLQATVTYRRGKDLGAVADLGVLQQVQEVYGRGQTWRLTQFWYQQTFADGGVDLKAGRLTQGEDFADFSCQLMNLTFCGAPPGNLAGDYWYNWPVSQWGARGRVSHGTLYAMVGAYEINPRNLDKDFTIGHFHGATGVMVPAEVGIKTRRGAARLPASYKLGGWYNSANGDDTALGLDRRPLAVNGLAPLRRDGRYGIYLQLQQQLSGTATDGPDGPEATHGLVVFLNVTQTDRRTSLTDNQIAAGLFYTGLLKARPKDDFGVAIGRTNVNGRASATLLRSGERPNAEYAAEIAYGLHATDWLILRPNAQFIVDPGGFHSAHDVVILGLKGAVTF